MPPAVRTDFAPDGAVSILEMDPPEHIAHRRLVTSVFTPRHIAKLEGHIREITQVTLMELPTQLAHATRS